MIHSTSPVVVLTRAANTVEVAQVEWFVCDDWMSPVKGVNIPTTDVYTKDNELVVEAHLPNFDQKDVDIRVENNALVVSAERHEKEEDKDKKYVVRESSSSFYRRVALPERADSGTGSDQPRRSDPASARP